MTDLQREFATDVVRKLTEAGYVALFAGGCVRDLLLNRPAKDYDVATTARPDEVRNLFGHRRTLAVGASFGVIIVLGPQNSVQIEVATFRREGEYTDGRRPDQVEFCTPEEDARRRDFTINGMFYDPLDSRVLDYVGGERDLAARMVRAIGEPHDRMREDKLRLLRAVRFAATLDFQLDAVTAAAVREMATQLTVVSAERIAQELKKMLVDVHRRRAIELCVDVGLMPVILPELKLADMHPSLEMLPLLPEPRFELALAVLLHRLPAERAVREICQRLKLSNDEKERTTWLVTHQDDLRDSPRFSLAKLKRALSHPFHEDQLRLLKVKLLVEEADLHPVLFCEEFLAQTPQAAINPPPLITGDDLIQLGMSPGPRFREWLDQIRDAQLNEELHTREDALALAQRLRDGAAGGTP
ncbi:MAG: CCA tRNA nucleotidyltransferase [Planctomycetaceae bacterium]